MLMPEDTLGRELNDLVAMVNGGSGDDGFVDNQNWSLVSISLHYTKRIC